MSFALKNVPVPLQRPLAETVVNKFDTSDNGSQWIHSSIAWYRTTPWLNNIREFVQPRFLKVRGEALRHMGFQPYSDYQSDRSEGWRLMHAIIKRFIAGAKSVPVLSLPLPNYFFYLYKVKPLYQALFESLATSDKNIHVADVTEPLAEMPWKTRRQLCFEHDTHFSPFGHREMASAPQTGDPKTCTAAFSCQNKRSEEERPFSHREADFRPRAVLLLATTPQQH